MELNCIKTCKLRFFYGGGSSPGGDRALWWRASSEDCSIPQYTWGVKANRFLIPVLVIPNSTSYQSCDVVST